MSKHSKLYKDSPSIEKDEDGKPGIKKPSKADAESMGTEGNALEGAGDGMPVTASHEAMQDMVERHSEELKDLHKRHAKEHDKMLSKQAEKKDKE